MKVGIISIGDELVNGFTIDTNSSWISNQIFRYEKLEISEKIAIGDSEDVITRNLDNLIKKEIAFIFITGGLGPTHDDITKSALCNYFNCSSRLVENHYKDLKKRLQNKGLKIGKHLRSQCEIIDSSEPIINSKGTALGMFINYKKSKIFVFPGVPTEMKTMFLNEVLPKFIDPFFKKKNKFLTILTTGVYESKLYEILLSDIQSNEKEFKVAFLPSYSGVKIRILKKNYLVSDNKLNLFKNDIVKKIKKYVYGYDNDTIQNIVVNNLIRNNLTIATAESCTGGLVSKMITDVPGSSKCFLGGVIAYSNLIKNSVLEVPNTLIEKCGPVSKEVVVKMAEGAMRKFNSDISIAITGISGPSNLEENKITGLVWIAVKTKTNISVREFNIFKNRDIHREVSAKTSLNMLRLLLDK